MSFLYSLQYTYTYTQWRILTGPDSVMHPPCGPVTVVKEMRYCNQPCLIVSSPAWPEGQALSSTAPPELVEWGRVLLKEGWADRKRAAIQTSKRKNKLHLKCFSDQDLPGASSHRWVSININPWALHAMMCKMGPVFFTRLINQLWKQF